MSHAAFGVTTNHENSRNMLVESKGVMAIF